MTFPIVYWPAWDADASFFPAAQLPSGGEERLWAVLAFLFHGGEVVLADIAGRGYCIPSGKIEAGETALEAMEREAFEETGARVDGHGFRLIGYYSLTPRAVSGAARCCPVFVAEADRFEAIPDGSESKGVKFAQIGEVPSLYFLWDDLMEAVFGYAQEQYARLLNSDRLLSHGLDDLIQVPRR